MPPPGNDAGTPNDGNQLMSWGRVRKTIAQNIHFAKFPPINASGTDPCRRLSPDSTRQMTAAEGASNSINLMKSVISCGGAIVFSFQIERRGGAFISSRGPPPNAGLCNSSGALGDPVF